MGLEDDDCQFEVLEGGNYLAGGTALARTMVCFPKNGLGN